MKTDKQLCDDVLAELEWDPTVTANAIGVEVRDGVVTLQGHVASYAEKYDAERVVQRVSGVRALVVEIDVKLDQAARRRDEDIANAAANTLKWTMSLSSGQVKVAVEQGWLTLTGEVDWEYQRRSAEFAVRYLAGVTGVSNEVTLKPATTVADVKTEIEAALKRRAAADTRTIAVAVNGAKVTLSGTVRSWSDRDLAIAAAWGAPGVSSVVDNIDMA